MREMQIEFQKEVVKVVHEEIETPLYCSALLSRFCSVIVNSVY